MNAMDSPLIITANTRLSRVLLEDFDRKQIANGKAVWTPPDILPVRAWLERSWRSWIYQNNVADPVQLLSDAQELAIWEGIVAGSDAGRELLQVAPTAEAAALAWLRAVEWRVPFDTEDWTDSRDTEVFREWAGEFQRICRKRNSISAAQLPEFVAAKISSGEIPIPSHIQLAGFSEFTPVQDHLFGTMRRRNSIVETLSAPHRSGRESAVRVKFNDSLHEIQMAALWARAQLEASLSKGGTPTIGVVVSELSKHRSAIERLFAEELHPEGRMLPDRDSRRAFNISLGPALSEYPLIQSALRVLRMSPSDNISFDDVTTLLRSPFLAKSQTESAACAALDRQLRRRREPELTLSDVTAFAPQGLKSALGEWARDYARTIGMQFPSVWSAAFAGELNSIGWPGERPLNSAEFQTTVAWNALHSELAALDSVAGAVNRSTAVSMLVRLAAGPFQPESAPAPIQILGELEASGMIFDHLWILGMHDGVWPRSTTPNPFIPLRLQRRLNLPESSAARALEFTQLLTDQLLASAAHIVVSYPSKEGDTDLRPSPLFSGIREIPANDLGLPAMFGYTQQLLRTQNTEEIQDSIAPPWKGSRARGGTSIFLYQAACPFQAFAKIRLGAEPFEPAEPGLSAIDRGILLHKVLEAVWRDLGSHETLVTESESYLSALVHDEIESCIRKMAATKRALAESRFAAIEQTRLERLVRDWLEIEKARKPFIVLPPEERQDVNVGGIALTIRADRIDRLEDGTHIVVDYKTSPHRPTEWDGDRPDDPQLPLYVITANVPMAGVVFGALKTGESRFAGLTSADGIIPGIKAATGDDALAKRELQWREVMENLAAEFRSGKAAVDPKNPNQTCRRCGLDSLCRIRESNFRDEGIDDSADEGSDD